MSARPKVLLLVHRVPFPPNRGDRIRSYHLLRHLAGRASVHLATLADEPLEPGTREHLASLCERVEIQPVGRERWVKATASLASGRSATEGLFHNVKLGRTVETWSRQTCYDAAIAFCSSMVPYLGVSGLRAVPAIVDLVDVDSQKFFDYASVGHGLKTWLYRLEGRRLRTLESNLAPNVKAVTLTSEAEVKLYRSFCSRYNTIAVSNGVDLEYFAPQRQDARPDQCVFVGALDYKPNIDGIVWFCKQVWPRIRASRSSATLTIVGRNPDPAVRNLSAVAGVHVAGSVPDVRPFMAEAGVVVVPLQIARGVQNKVLEALAMAKPLVATPQALEGLALQRGEHALQASDPDQWIDCLTSLFDEPETRKRLGSAGRQYVRTHHAWDACLAPFEQLLSDVIDESTDRKPFSRAAGPDCHTTNELELSCVKQ